MKRLFKNYNREMLMIIWALAWPTMLEQAMHTAVQYIDTAMVGSLGTHATAAVGATSTVQWLVGSTVMALGIGFLSYIAKAFGAGDKEAVKSVSAQAASAVFVMGTLLTVITCGLSPYVPVWMQVDPVIQSTASLYFFIIYAPMLPRTASMIFGTILRAAGDSKTPMKIGILMNLINVVLNYLLIYPVRTVTFFSLSFMMPGAGLGVIGAAIATAASYVIGGLLMTVIVYRHPLVSFKGQSFKPDMTILHPCLKVALPNMLQRFTTSLGYVVFAAMINSVGEVATAAHTIANTVESAFYIPGYGMQSAAATLAGNAYGAKDHTQMKSLAQMFVPLEIGLMSISGLALFILAPSLVSIFSQSKDVISLGSTVLRMVAVTEPFYGYSIIIEGFMQGVGKTKEPFLYNIIGMWLIRIIGTFICIQFFSLGLISAWACMIAHNLFLFVMFMFCHISGKWNPLHLDKTVL